MSNQENNTAQNSVLNTIHKVEGFDPAAYAVPYVDLNTGETRKSCRWILPQLSGWQTVMTGILMFLQLPSICVNTH